MKKLTKKMIEKLAEEVKAWAKDNKLGNDWMLFYNGKRYYHPYELGVGYSEIVEEGINPIDYCKYYPEKFIMGMAYDGTIYEVINGYRLYKVFDKLEKLLSKYGLYMEPIDSCHCHFHEDEEMEVEYTYLHKPKEHILFRPGSCVERWTHKEAEYPKIFDSVMDFWEEYSANHGPHAGYCIIGEGIEFDFKGTHYRMHSQCKWQGSVHFEQCAKVVEVLLREIGAEKIRIDYGRLD